VARRPIHSSWWDAAAWARGAAAVRFVARALALGALALALVQPAGAGASARDAGAVKARMLCDFARFVRWPDASFERTGGQLVFTVIGHDAVTEALAGATASSINGHPVSVRTARRVEDTAGGQVIYIAASEFAKAPEVLRRAAGSPVLTVADRAGFVEHGGMVDFDDAPDHERFEINQARAEKAGLKISARLLAVARVVDEAP